LSVNDPDAAPEAWWGDLDAAVMACLEARGAMAPNELGRHVGLSESAAVSLVCMLALEGRVQICLVEPGPARAAATRAA
jgi:hypothetical protein